MKNIINILWIAACIMLITPGCYNDKTDKLYPQLNSVGANCDTTNVTYSATISPILAQNCSLSGCHDASTMAGGYNLANYGDTKNAANSGMLLKALKPNSGVPQMPLTGSLSTCDIKKISIWVNTGSPNN